MNLKSEQVIKKDAEKQQWYKAGFTPGIKYKAEHEQPDVLHPQTREKKITEDDYRQEEKNEDDRTEDHLKLNLTV